MSENETNPRPADAAADNTSAERVESEQPTLAQPPVAPQSGAPQSAAPEQTSAWAQKPSWQPQQPASGEPTAAQPVSAQPMSAQPMSTHPVSAQPVSAQPVSAQPAPTQSLPAHPVSGQPVTAQPASGVPYEQPHYAYQSPQGYGQQPGYQDYAQQQAAYQAWHAAAAAQAAGAGGNVPPGWNQPPGAGDQRRPGQGRKIFVAGAAAVLIALASGGIGAATALAMDDDGRPNSVQTGNSSVTRVVDRSSLAQIAAAVQDSVVSITTGSGEGSGVVLTADGYIVTNNHVVSTAQSANVTVIFANGTKTTAKVIGTDERTDLAVIKAEGVSSLKAGTFGNSSQIQVGDTVLALGSPLGLQGSVTAGIISAKDRAIQAGGGREEPQSPWGQQPQQQGSPTMTGLLQTDAPINPGNSGGALVNTNGEVIGINSAIATSGAGTGNIGLGFAIPSNKAKQVAEELMQGKKVSHPALGVSVTNAENGGAVVSAVVENSAAAKAQLQRGDVVTKVDGKAIDDSDDLVAAVQAGTVGQQMTLTFTRNGSEQTVTVTLQEAQ
ncbi:trypsin-like peptidase domain-containing protein [Actinoplanes sp. NEAU-A12]|uniref:Trypsin-like peptidase domain-containing protein n=1 Tax=Actinoplanes sandaracinus TaxID=3045177 RepID=A0ABT6WDS1_9ACTN|nr:trypsin-like peptidase domain-containing protein [Actinoplanes sandaracinus]MDI6097865.1 trypsin-like peptidase domain-containing protein [Actinoplanes sandaracinus]